MRCKTQSRNKKNYHNLEKSPIALRISYGRKGTAVWWEEQNTNRLEVQRQCSYNEIF
jgi:hypothetical protein